MAVYANRGKRTEPQYGIEGSSATTRWTYTRPTEKPQPKKEPITSYDIDDYGLPVIDTQTQRRNFPGYTESQVYSLADLQMGDTSGTTETDSATHPQGSGGYTKINQKSGPTSRWPNRRT